MAVRVLARTARNTYRKGKSSENWRRKATGLKLYVKAAGLSK